MTPPLIIGGGPAGAAAAIHLVRAGHVATLLERTSGPTDKVCGDFLSAEAVTALQGLGLDPAALGAAPIGRLRLVHATRVAETVLPFPALGLSRRILDEALIGRAAALGVRVHRAETVQALDAAGNRLEVRTTSADLTAETVFLATGKHDLRGAPRSARDTGRIGLKTYLRLSRDQHAALQGHVELVLFHGGYAGLQPVEGGAAVLCAVVDKAAFAAVGGTWTTLLHSITAGCPHLASRLAGSDALRDRPVAIAGIPYGHLHRPTPDDPPALFRLGDQACVIPSLTGDGVAIALHSAGIAVETWLTGGDAADHHRRLATALQGQMRLAGMLHRLCLGPLQGWVATFGQAAPALLRHAAAWTRLRPAAYTTR
ncbi:MAG: FAD-dependent monooxygenase [Acetobacteraceae bacterium]|nr:FAD-dependent monooxygenase [Acetobacteraceae bacterium]